MTDASGTSLTLGDHARDLLRPAVIVAPDATLRTIAHTLWEESVGAAVVGTAHAPWESCPSATLSRRSAKARTPTPSPPARS